MLVGQLGDFSFVVVDRLLVQLTFCEPRVRDVVPAGVKVLRNLLFVGMFFEVVSVVFSFLTTHIYIYISINHWMEEGSVEEGGGCLVLR